MRRMVLYDYWRSSSSFRIRFALAVKKLAYESVAVNLRSGENNDANYLARSPTAFVPCLMIDGTPFIESVALIELLEDLHPLPALFPSEPFHRARVRALVEIVNAGTQPLQNLNVLKHLSNDESVQKKWSHHFIDRGLHAFEAAMRQNESAGVIGRFAFGNTLTAADIFLVPQVYNARRFSVSLDPYPRVRAASDAALATEAARAALPENQPDAPQPTRSP